MIKKLKELYYKQTSFDDRMFFIILISSTVLLVFSTIFTIFEDISQYAILLLLGVDVCCVATFIIAYIFHDIKKAKSLLYFIVLFVFIPLSFFFNGALKSGMPLYMLAATAIIVPSLSGKKRIIIFLTITFYYVGNIILSYYILDKDILFIPKVTQDYTTLDYSISFIICALFIYILMSLIFRAYNKERAKNLEALKELQRASTHDALTGISNRRFLYDSLEAMGEDVFSHSNYIAMFDIDFFKKVNDTYGHQFGDKALRIVAGEIKRFTNEDIGEIVARYGGEEFIYFMHAKNNDEAYKRTDKIRSNCEKLKWEEKDTPITISGGLIHCSDYTDLTHMMSEVDSLLYKAKSCGRNCICKKL